MNGMDVSVVLLTRNGGPRLRQVLDAVLAQDYTSYEVLVIDSSSTDGTVPLVLSYTSWVKVIPAREFGHGKTRNLGANLAKGDFVVYLTQDSVPASRRWLSNLIRNFANPQIAGVYGRQIPLMDSDPAEKYQYAEDYPIERKLWTQSTLGDSNVIFSDVNSAIRRSVLLRHPFSDQILVSEDLDWALRVISLGHIVAYDPEAAVIHSHNYSLQRTFKLYFDIGVSYTQMAFSRRDISQVGNSSARFFRRQRWLWKNRMCWLALYDLVVTAIKSLGFYTGRSYRRLPSPVVRLCSAYQIIDGKLR